MFRSCFKSSAPCTPSTRRSENSLQTCDLFLGVLYFLHWYSRTFSKVIVCFSDDDCWICFERQSMSLKDDLVESGTNSSSCAYCWCSHAAASTMDLSLRSIPPKVSLETILGLLNHPTVDGQSEMLRCRLMGAFEWETPRGPAVFSLSP